MYILLKFCAFVKGLTKFVEEICSPPAGGLEEATQSRATRSALCDLLYYRLRRQAQHLRERRLRFARSASPTVPLDPTHAHRFELRSNRHASAGSGAQRVTVRSFALCQGYENFLNLSRNSLLRFADPRQTERTVRKRKVRTYSKIFLDPLRGNLDKAHSRRYSPSTASNSGARQKDKEKPSCTPLAILPPRNIHFALLMLLVFFRLTI